MPLSPKAKGLMDELFDKYEEHYMSGLDAEGIKEYAPVVEINFFQEILNDLAAGDTSSLWDKAQKLPQRTNKY